MKVLIVGGGLLGLSTAKVLQKDHCEVELIEAAEDVSLGASYANGGILTSSMSDPWNAPGVHKHLLTSLFEPYSPMKLHASSIPSVFLWGLKFLRNSSHDRYTEATKANYQLSQYAMKKTAQLRDQLGLLYEFSPSGSLKIFRDRKAMETPRNLAVILAKFGLRFTELTVDQTIEIEPQLFSARDQIAGSLYFPDDQCGDANLFCLSLANEIKNDGGTIRLKTKASGLIIEKGQVLGVDTKDGPIMADSVIVATGAETPMLLKNTNISLPIEPVKGYGVTFVVDQGAELPKVPVIDDAMHAAITPLGRRLRAVGAAEFTGFDTSIQQTQIDKLHSLLSDLYPDIAANIDKAATESWAGLRPTSSDGKPFIGSCDINRLYFNVGHGHLGWTMAMGSAHIVADIIMARPPAIDSSPFRINR